MGLMSVHVLTKQDWQIYISNGEYLTTSQSAISPHLSLAITSWVSSRVISTILTTRILTMSSDPPPALDRPRKEGQCASMFQSQAPTLAFSFYYRPGALFPAQTNNLFNCSFPLDILDLRPEEFDPPLLKDKAKELYEFNFFDSQFNDDEKDSTTGRRDVHSFQEKVQRRMFRVG
jgi:hypothetical protein